MESTYSLETLSDAIQPLVGMPVTRPWQGFGSSICLELGNLSPHPRGLGDKGQASVFVEWDWRVENAPFVAFGSSQSRPRIKRGIEGLRGATVETAVVGGRVPELEVGFSNGSVLRTMVMTAGPPQWHVRLEPDIYLSAKSISEELGCEAPDRAEWEEERELWRYAAERWNRSAADTTRGKCRDCLWYVGLDGGGHLIEYGVCGSSKSPFDGRAVRESCGCPAFRFADARIN